MGRLDEVLHLAQRLQLALDQLRGTEGEGGEAGGQGAGAGVLHGGQFAGGLLANEEGHELLAATVGGEQDRVLGHVGEYGRNGTGVQATEYAILAICAHKAVPHAAIYLRKGLQLDLDRVEGLRDVHLGRTAQGSRHEVDQPLDEVDIVAGTAAVHV